MSKNFKRCPRCNFKSPTNAPKCGGCGLNYAKFNAATNAEAKSAFRMGEKERVLHTRQVPSDINKIDMLIKCALGGWFGLHYFSVGKLWRGGFQTLGVLMMFVYAIFAGKMGIRTGFAGNAVLMCGLIWLASFIIWFADILAIVFNRFKYPVSLPYSNQKEVKEK